MTRFLMPATTLTTLKKVAFTLFCCTVLMVFAAPAQTPQQIKADPGTNNPPPAGAILDLSGTPIPGGGNRTYQQYTVNFTAGIANTAITFAFRDDPAFISFTNASVVDQTVESSNLLTNGDFSGGTYTDPVSGNTSVPNNWTYANIYGATFGGVVESGFNFCYTINDVTVNDCWYDGAVQAYDAISQTITTTVGHNYQISFFVAEDSSCVTDGGGPTCNFSDISTNGDTIDTGGNGINVTVYAQAGLPSGASQTQTLEPGVTAVYPAGHDNSKWTPSNTSHGGEQLTVTAVPIPQASFVPPAPFGNELCVPYKDFTAANGGVPTCVGFQTRCVDANGSADCSTLPVTVMTNYDLPDNLPAIGGPDFLVFHGQNCPPSPTAVAQSIFLAYGVNRFDPYTKGGSTPVSCYIATYTPGAPLITGTGTTVSTAQFVGFQSPVSDTDVNLIKAGSAVPLKWQVFDASGIPITDLTFCGNAQGTGCTGDWVNLSTVSIACPSDPSPNTATDTIQPAGNSGLQNLGNGNYQFNWKTVKGSKGCVNIRVTFSFGLVLTPAQLGFKYQ